MKTYEMLYVLDMAISDEEKEAFVSKFENIVTANGGTVVSTDKWSAKTLSYPIKYKTDGWYALMTFEAEGAVVKELDRIAGLSAEVLRRMITVK